MEPSGSGQTLRIVNRTALSTAWLEQLVELVRPAGLAGELVVEFLPARDGALEHSGFAYPERRAVRVWIAREAVYPLGVERPRRRRAGPQPAGQSPIRLRSIQEAVLFITAHELLHLWQAEHGRFIAPGIRYLDERDANAYAARALRRYRRAGSPGLPWPPPIARSAAPDASTQAGRLWSHAGYMIGADLAGMAPRG